MTLNVIQSLREWTIILLSVQLNSCDAIHVRANESEYMDSTACLRDWTRYYQKVNCIHLTNIGGSETSQKLIIIDNASTKKFEYYYIKQEK